MKQETILMNRVILLGNGFDLAHKLKTTYNDFIIWYLNQAIENARVHREYKDELMSVSHIDIYAMEYLIHHGIRNVPDFVDHFYKIGFHGMISSAVLKFPGWQNEYTSPFKFKVHSNLFTILLLNCSDANWVDIENIFYDQLKLALRNEDMNEREKKVKRLNHSLKIIIDYLERYLKTLNVIGNTTDYKAILESNFDPDEFVGLSDQEYSSVLIDHSMILNFNYTSTIENYIKDVKHSKFTLNYIHGKLGDEKNSLIFGFGDELDSDYAGFELDRTKGIFDYIKSFWYFKTSNYHSLIRFIDSAPYQVYTLGHSCGLSDRTMLNMIFEHKNCRSVKIFYHQNGNSTDYTRLTQEIARHFKNKQDMRRKIVPFDKSSPMPQVLL